MRGSDEVSKDGAVCFSYGGFTRFLSVLNERFGSAGDSILFAMSRDFGVYDIHTMLQMGAFRDAEGDEEKIFRAYLRDVERLGWGMQSLDSFDMIKGEVIISVQEFGLTGFCENENSPYCLFIKGVVSGILKEITEQDFYAESVECDREHPRCRFKFYRKLR